MNRPLMPKATAVWLVDNTTLSFKQIADFCGMHELEVQAIADGDIATNIMGLNPIIGGQITAEEIKACEADSTRTPQMAPREELAPRKKGVKYTPMAKRVDRPNAIAWIIKHHPEIDDTQIIKLIRTTHATIESIRNKTHKNMEEITPQSPVFLGLCTEEELEVASATSVKHIEVK